MTDTPNANHADESPKPEILEWLGIPFRPDLAFPKLPADMVERLRAYGHEETFPAGVRLYTYGDRNIDLFVVLDGGVDIFLPEDGSEPKIYNQIRTFNFGGELNLLNSQGAVVEAQTVEPTRVLRIPHAKLRELMRAEGDIANILVQASIWRRLRIVQAAKSGVVVKGRADDPEMMLLRRFFLRNIYPHRVVEFSDQHPSETPDPAMKYPVVLLPGGKILQQPEIPELADLLGITELPDPKIIFDVAIIGAGPAGLAAAVYAASEGLSTVVIESLAPGGQAGTSSKIENYLGFPTGIGGAQLAIRAQLQALKFGVSFAISRAAVGMHQADGLHHIELAGTHSLCARSVVVATGAHYRTLNVKNYRDFENKGLYYAATAMEGNLCRDREIIVVGGGNSAGQASLFLSSVAKHVHHIVRGPSFVSTMSQYLISRIDNSRRITVYNNSEIVALEGNPSLSSVAWLNKASGERTDRPIQDVFVMIGAEPNTGFLYGSVKLDSKGFVCTGPENGFQNGPYSTSMPGIFAVGDVRANSVKRIASAVGEGSVVISDVHRYLASRTALEAASTSAAVPLPIPNAPAR
jgi:thioredoxin reductase (NADPH)